MSFKVLTDLFFTFARIGGFTFGGAYAMFPLMQRELAEQRGWVTESELLDYFAIGQCTPGIIAVNTATFVGRKAAGIPGGIIATLGLVFPSVIIITAIAALISSFSSIPAVQDALAGIRVCVCILMFNAVLKMLKKSIVDKFALILYLAAMLALLFLEMSPVPLIAVAAVCGILAKAGREAVRQ